MAANHKGLIISVCSSKGGVGKTLIASNLSAALKKNSQQNVIYFDLNINSGGDISEFIALSREPVDFYHNIMDLVDELDMEEMKSLFGNYHGVDVLPMVSYRKKLYLKESLNTDVIGRANKALTKFINYILAPYYGYVIIDTPSTFTPIMLDNVLRSDFIILVITPDLLSLKQTEWFLNKMKELIFPFDNIKVVFNMCDSSDEATVQQYLAHLNLESNLLGIIPRDPKSVSAAILAQTPIACSFSASPIFKSFDKLSHTVNEMKQQYTGKVRVTVDGGQAPGRAEPLSDEEGRKFQINNYKIQLHKKLLEEMDKLQQLDDEKLREQITNKVENYFTAEKPPPVDTPADRERLKKEILDEVLGYGPIEDFLEDPDITEIMVVGRDMIYIDKKIEKRSRMFLSDKTFISNDQLMTVIRKILMPVGRTINEKIPYVDARLLDGSRVHAIIPPLSLKGPTLTIRKFSKDKLTVDDLVSFGSMDKNIAMFLELCVRERKNIVISGGTGSGKTTLLNIVGNFIPDEERIITVEDSAELTIYKSHVVTLEARPPNIEGEGAVTIRDLVRNCLRMRPDRIIVGECRGGEALDMLQAMNTGHDGSLTTAHANNPSDLIIRLETMVLMSGMELPLRAIRQQIASAVDIIVQQSRLKDGSRKIEKVTEVIKFDEEREDIITRDIFEFVQHDIDSRGVIIGSFRPSGHIPGFINDLRAKKVEFPVEIFTPPSNTMEIQVN